VNIRGQDVSWKTLVGIVATAGLSALPAIRSGSLEGMSQILTVAYLFTWVTAATRLGFHLYEGYAWLGLWRQMCLEFATVTFLGVLVLLTSRAEDPQVPRLVACGGIATVLFFLSATLLERARAELAGKEDGVRLRRATDVLRESCVWGQACDLFRQLDSRTTKKVGRWLAGPDTKDGMLSRAAFIALCALASIAVAAGGMAMVGTVLGMPLTPTYADGVHKEPDGDSSPRGGRHYGSVPPSPNGAEAPQASIDDDCGIEYDPGPRVPEPERSSLMLAWHEVDGIPPGPLEALGSDIPGCPGRARPIPAKPDWWYAPGYCEGRLRSIAIAPEGMEHPVVLLEQAAEFALPLILHREFVDAVDRFRVGDGDAYVIDATAGSYVLIRAHRTGGRVTDDLERSGGCNNFVDEDVPYNVVGPMLIAGWRSIAAISQGGVYPIASAHNSGAVESFSFLSPAGVEAEGRCWTAQETCGVEIEGDWIMGEAETRASQEEVEALVEP
jgi:hypothetical protein